MSLHINDECMYTCNNFLTLSRFTINANIIIMPGGKWALECISLLINLSVFAMCHEIFVVYNADCCGKNRSVRGFRFFFSERWRKENVGAMHYRSVATFHHSPRYPIHAIDVAPFYSLPTTVFSVRLTWTRVSLTLKDPWYTFDRLISDALLNLFITSNIGSSIFYIIHLCERI